MTPFPRDAISGSYIWSHPSCSVRILLAFDAIDRLTWEIHQNDSARELGGLLIASKKSAPGTVKIVDLIPFPPELHDADSHFRPSADWVAEAIARCPSDTRVVGYFRTDLEQNIHLRASDLEAMPSCTRDSTGIFLVIAANGPEASAGFFIRDNGAVAANPSLTFPFSSARLIAEGWPRMAEPSGKWSRLRDALIEIGHFVSGGNLLVRLGVVSGALALLCGIFLLIRNITASPAIVSPRLGLQLQRDGGRFLISWDRSASSITPASDAGLVIQDDSRTTSDGSVARLFMALTPSQLHAGSLTYTSPSASGNVEFRLYVGNPSGQAVSESVVSLSPLSADSKLSKGGAGRARNAGLSRSKAALAGPEARSQKLRGRTFIPPKPKAGNAPYEAVMLEPPDIAMPAEPAPAVTSGPPPQLNSKPPAPDRQSQEGLVTITSEPSGANVEINAVPAGITPLTLQVKPIGLGFTVTVTRVGFMRWTVQTCSTARPYALHAQLSPAPK